MRITNRLHPLLAVVPGAAFLLYLLASLLAVAGCAGAGSKLIIHKQSTAPAKSASRSEPHQWWTDRGGFKRQARGACTYRGGSFAPGRIDLPSYSHGPLIDAVGRLWLASDYALYVAESAASAPQTISDPSQQVYLHFSLCPDGTVIAVRVPVTHAYTRKEWIATREQMEAKTEVAKLTALGATAWTWSPACSVETVLPVPNGSIYCLVQQPRAEAAASVLYALSGNGELLWELHLADKLGVAECFAFADDSTLYCATASGALYCIAPDGAVKWKHRAERAVDWKRLGKVKLPLPAASSIGHFGRTLLTDKGDIVYSAGNDRPVYCVSPQGRRRWQFRPKRDFTLNMAAAPDGSLYIADHCGWLYKLDGSGQMLWSTQTDSWTATEIACDEIGNVYCACKDLDVIVLNSGGKELYRGRLPGWPNNCALSNDGTFYSSTNLAVALGGNKAGVYFLRAKSQAEK